MRVISVACMVFAPDLPDPGTGRDTTEAAWIPWTMSKETAFDAALSEIDSATDPTVLFGTTT